MTLKTENGDGVLFALADQIEALQSVKARPAIASPTAPAEPCSG